MRKAWLMMAAGVLAAGTTLDLVGTGSTAE